MHEAAIRIGQSDLRLTRRCQLRLNVLDFRAMGFQVGNCLLQLLGAQAVDFGFNLGYNASRFLIMFVTPR